MKRQELNVKKKTQKSAVASSPVTAPQRKSQPREPFRFCFSFLFSFLVLPRSFARFLFLYLLRFPSVSLLHLAWRFPEPSSGGKGRRRRTTAKKKIKWEEAKKKIVFCFPRALPNANERAKFEKKQQKNDSIQEADTIIDIDLDLDFLSTVPLSLSLSLSLYRTGFRRYSICFLRCTGLVFLILFFLFFKRCFTAF